MFESIAGLPEGVIGLAAVGSMEAADYEDVLMPMVTRAAAGGGVRLVLVLGESFAGFTPGAMKDDAVLGWMLQGQFERFGLAERDAAIASVAEPG